MTSPCEDIVEIPHDLEVGINLDNNECFPASTICILLDGTWPIDGSWSIC